MPQESWEICDLRLACTSVPSKWITAEVFNRGPAEVLQGGRKSFGWSDIFLYSPAANFSTNWNVFKYTSTWIQHTSRVYMDTSDPISNRNRSTPIMRSECMAFTKVVCVRSYVSRTHLTHLDQRRHFYAFDFNESPAGESFPLPAPSIKKESTATSVLSSGLYIYPLLRRKQEVFGWECAAKTVWRERECCYLRDNVQKARHYQKK